MTHSPLPTPLPLASTIGILGAGQLGMMLAQAATKLGYKTHIYAPDSDPIAAKLATHFTQASYEDAEQFATFANSVNVITLEFENVPVSALAPFARKIHPSPSVLATSQHRVTEKTFAQSLGIATAPFMAVKTQDELNKAIKEIGSGILKTCTMGYDGKGQWKITDGHFTLPEDGDYIYEGFVRFEKEISVIVARSINGEVECFEPVENVHKNHILHTTTAPANINNEVRKKAMDIAITLATKINVVGLLAVEMFVTSTNDVLVNEVAPRPHNSGHWTLDGCNVSQFEQAIRAVTGLPLIKPERLAKTVIMTNLIGDDIAQADALRKQGGHVMLYGKAETRPGRKMGHVTELKNNTISF